MWTILWLDGLVNGHGPRAGTPGRPLNQHGQRTYSKITQDRDCSLIARLPCYCPWVTVTTWHWVALGLGRIAYISPAR
jgi:hypothetical protein